MALPPAALVQTDLDHSIPPSVPANICYSSDNSSIMVQFESIDRKREELTTLPLDYQIILQTANGDTLLRDNKSTALGTIVLWLLEGQDKLKPETKDIVFLS